MSEASDLEDSSIVRYSRLVGTFWCVFSLYHFSLGRPLTASTHGFAATLAVAGSVLIGRRPSSGNVAILLLVGGALCALFASAMLAGERTGVAAMSLTLVPLVTGLIGTRWLRVTVLALSLAAIALVQAAALHFGVLESMLASGNVASLVYLLGAERRLRSDAQIERLAAQRAEIPSAKAVRASAAKVGSWRSPAMRSADP